MDENNNFERGNIPNLTRPEVNNFLGDVTQAVRGKVENVAGEIRESTGSLSEPIRENVSQRIDSVKNDFSMENAQQNIQQGFGEAKDGIQDFGQNIQQQVKEVVPEEIREKINEFPKNIANPFARSGMQKREFSQGAQANPWGDNGDSSEPSIFSQNQVYQNSQEPAQPKKSKIGIVIAVIILFLALIGGGVFAFFALQPKNIYAIQDKDLTCEPDSGAISIKIKAKFAKDNKFTANLNFITKAELNADYEIKSNEGNISTISLSDARQKIGDQDWSEQSSYNVNAEMDFSNFSKDKTFNLKMFDKKENQNNNVLICSVK